MSEAERTTEVEGAPSDTAEEHVGAPEQTPPHRQEPGGEGGGGGGEPKKGGGSSAGAGRTAGVQPDPDDQKDPTAPQQGGHERRP